MMSSQGKFAELTIHCLIAPVFVSDTLCLYLLDTHRLSLVPGSAFGAPRCLRISYASSDEIVMAGVKKMEAALAELEL